MPLRAGLVSRPRAFHHPRMYKLLTWFFLLIYPTLARKPLAVFDCIAGPDDTFVLRDDPVEPCFEGTWIGWAIVSAAIGVLLYGFGLPLLGYALAWRHRDGEPRERERISLLVDSYKSQFWACESLILMYNSCSLG